MGEDCLRATIDVVTLAASEVQPLSFEGAPLRMSRQSKRSRAAGSLHDEVLAIANRRRGSCWAACPVGFVVHPWAAGCRLVHDLQPLLLGARPARGERRRVFPRR